MFRTCKVLNKHILINGHCQSFDLFFPININKWIKDVCNGVFFSPNDIIYTEIYHQGAKIKL